MVDPEVLLGGVKETAFEVTCSVADAPPLPERFTVPPLLPSQRVPVPLADILKDSLALLESVLRLTPLPATFEVRESPVAAFVVEAKICNAGLVTPFAPTVNVLDASVNMELPALLITNREVVADAVELETRKIFEFVSALLAEIASFAHGVVVPTPMFVPVNVSPVPEVIDVPLK